MQHLGTIVIIFVFFFSSRWIKTSTPPLYAHFTTQGNTSASHDFPPTKLIQITLRGDRTARKVPKIFTTIATSNACLALAVRHGKELLLFVLFLFLRLAPSGIGRVLVWPFLWCLDTLHQAEGTNMLWMRRRLHFWADIGTAFFAGGGLFSIAEISLAVAWLNKELKKRRENTHKKLLASSGHIGRRLESYVDRNDVVLSYGKISACYVGSQMEEQSRLTDVDGR